MIKTFITPKEKKCLIEIPSNYIGKELEILIYAKDELTLERNRTKSMSDFQGILSDETSNAMHQEVKELRNSWDERLENQF